MYANENDLAHGEFGKWCEKEFGFKRSVASKFMKVVDEIPQTNVSTLTHFGLSALHLIATMRLTASDSPTATA